MRWICLVLAVLAALMIADHAYGQQGRQGRGLNVCNSPAIVEALLRKKYREAVVWQGFAHERDISVQVMANEEGTTWSLVFTKYNDEGRPAISCLMNSGGLNRSLTPDFTVLDPPT